MAMKYDVVVVGAGPAGSMAAKFASQGGAKVLMIEKRQEIGSPVRCGEGLAKSSVIKIGIKPDKKWIAHEVKGGKIISPDGTTIFLEDRMAGGEVGYVIHRDIFDEELAKDAARAGTDIIVKCSATDVIKEGGAIKGIKAHHMGENLEIRADLVIGADGFESQVARWAGIDTKLAPADVMTCYEYLMVGLDIDSTCNYFYVGPYYAPGGYVWIFMKGEDIANVGLGMQLSKVKEPGDPRRYLDLFVKRHPHIAKGKIVEKIAGGVSVGAPIDQTVADGIMLVGDAARHIDPLTGGGIQNGCVAGRIAGQVAAKAVKAHNTSKEFLMEYDKGWRADFEDKMWRNYIAKEKYVSLSDETINHVMHAIEGYDFKDLNTMEVLKAVSEKYPNIAKEFEDML